MVIPLEHSRLIPLIVLPLCIESVYNGEHRAADRRGNHGDEAWCVGGRVLDLEEEGADDVTQTIS